MSHPPLRQTLTTVSSRASTRWQQLSTRAAVPKASPTIWTQDRGRDQNIPRIHIQHQLSSIAEAWGREDAENTAWLRISVFPCRATKSQTYMKYLLWWWALFFSWTLTETFGQQRNFLWFRFINLSSQTRTFFWQFLFIVLFLVAGFYSTFCLWSFIILRISFFLLNWAPLLCVMFYHIKMFHFVFLSDAIIRCV